METMFVGCTFLHVNVTESQFFKENSVGVLNWKFVDLFDCHDIFALAEAFDSFIDEVVCFLDFSG